MHKVEPKIPEYLAEMKDPKPDYPRINLSLSTLPEMKDWPMNGKYKLCLEVELTGLYNNEGKGDATFEINAIGCEAMGEEKKEGSTSRKKVRASVAGDEDESY